LFRDSQEFEIGQAELFTGLTDRILGMRPGETREFILDNPTTTRSDPSSHKTVQVTVRMDSLSRLELAELDDAFAVDLGYETFAEVQHAVTRDVMHANRMRTETSWVEAVWDAVIARNPLVVPPDLIESTRAVIEEGLERELGSADPIRFGDPALHETLTRFATTRVERKFIAAAVARRSGIDVTESEYGDRIRRMAKQNGITVREATERIAGSSAQLLELHMEILTAKVTELLLQKYGLYHQESTSDADGPHGDDIGAAAPETHESVAE
jgi:trigger factor